MIEHAKMESQIFGLRMGRAEAVDLDPISFSQELLNFEYDVVRLKLPSKNPLAEISLKKTGIPFALSGIIEKFWISREVFDIKPQMKSGLTFEEYSPQWREYFRSSIRDCFSDQSLGFFDVPYFRTLVSPDLQIKAFTNYYIHQLDLFQKNLRGWCVLLNGKFVGFLINTVQEHTTETVLAGILPAFRNQQIYREIVRFSQNFGKECGKKGGYCGARIQNIISKCMFISEGMKPQESCLVYLLTPFFGLQRSSPQKSSFKTGSNPLNVIDHFLEKKLGYWKLDSLQLKLFYNWSGGEVSFQMIEEKASTAFALMGFISSDSKLLGSAWMNLTL